MRKGKVVERVSKIFDVLHRRTELNVEDITEVLSEPRGTISVCLSYMVRSGYLYRNSSLYSIRKHSDPREVALQIRKIIIEDKAMRKEKALIESRNLFSQPTPSASKIEAAIELLKSNGYKILKSKNQWEEV
jgi:predicted transcriptional regulator